MAACPRPILIRVDSRGAALNFARGLRGRFVPVHPLLETELFLPRCPISAIITKFLLFPER
jgi:hypothetical protein